MLSAFLNLRKSELVSIILADKTTTISATYSGDVIIPFQEVHIRLTSVLYAQELGFSLVSIGQLADHGIETVFSREMVLRKNDVLIGNERRDPDFNLFQISNPMLQNAVTCAQMPWEENVLWHRRLAHINSQDLTTT